MIRARSGSLSLVLSWAVAWLCSTTVPAPAGAQPPAEGDSVEIVEYTVQAGDTCGRIAQRMWGNARRYDLIHSFNPGMGPPPHHLVAGTVLRLPRVATAASSLPDARVTAAERRVTARSREEEAWREAHIGLDLYRGWHVVTEERSSAELTFRDTSVVAMRADTLVIIFGGAATRVRQGGTDATLERGSMRTALGALRGTGDASGGGGALALHVNMPSSQADLSGGSSVLSVDEGGTSRVSAHVGEVRLRGESGPVVRVPEGMGSAVTPHARPTPPRPLPPAPIWANGPRRFFGASGRGAVIAGEWSAAAGARTYHVEVAREPDGRGVVASTEVPESVTRFELHGFPPGTYYVRVSTIDTDFFESRPSEVLTVSAESATITLPGATEGASFPPIDPSEEPGALTLPLGTRVALPADVHCEGGASELVVTSETLPACADANGPVALLPVRVETVSLRADATTLAAGETREVSFGLVSGALPPDAALVAHGVTLTNVRRDGDHLLATVTAPADASEGSVDLVLGTTVLSSTPLAVTPAPAVETTETTPAVATETAEAEVVPVPDLPAAPGALTEAVGAMPFSESVGLRDLDVRGVGGRVSIGTIAAGEPMVRVALEAFGSVLDDQLRLSVAMPIDAASPRTQSWQDGSADLVAGVGWLPLRRGPVSLLVDAAIWIPTELDHGLSLARLVPSLEAAWLVGGTFHLRTRQAAMLDLADHGTRLWSSAYGMDARMVGPFGVGFEVELVVGDPDGTGVRSDYAFVPEIVLDFESIAVHVGGRFGINHPTYFGPAGLFVSARLAAF